MLSFGEEKGKLTHRFLLIQARIGIQRKNLDQIQDPQKKQATQAEIDSLRVEMDELRREVGTHTMMMLRSFFPDVRAYNCALPFRLVPQ